MISPGNKNRTTCVVCGCTWERPCAGGCAWASLKQLIAVNSDGPLCTTCVEMVTQLLVYAEDAHRFRPVPLMRAAKAALDAAARKTLRAACRA
jgi:hypothetical protein